MKRLFRFIKILILNDKFGAFIEKFIIALFVTILIKLIFG
jgi:hypothetical protein